MSSLIRHQDPDVAHYGYGGEPVYYVPAPRPAADEVPVSFARLADGSWGIRGIGLVSGTTVTVTKRSGETTEVVVGEVTPADPYSTDRRIRSAYDLATIARTPRPQREVTVEVTVEVPAADAADVVTVPDGRYAVYNDDQSVNDIGFYKVENVTTGDWAGWTFVKQVVGPEERKLSQKQGRRILAKINAFGQREASQLFGQNTQKCGVCNTNLTNKESREYGIGPDCRAKHGW